MNQKDRKPLMEVIQIMVMMIEEVTRKQEVMGNQEMKTREGRTMKMTWG